MRLLSLVQTLMLDILNKRRKLEIPFISIKLKNDYNILNKRKLVENSGS